MWKIRTPGSAWSSNNITQKGRQRSTGHSRQGTAPSDPQGGGCETPRLRSIQGQPVLVEVHGNQPHHKNGTHLKGGIANSVFVHNCWHWLVKTLSIWYNTSLSAVRCHFMAILEEEWLGVINWRWNSNRPLIFDHIVFSKTIGVCRAQEICMQIRRRMDLWEGGIHMGMEIYTEVERMDRERRTSREEEEEDGLKRRLHSTVLLVKFCQNIQWATTRVGKGGIFPWRNLAPIPRDQYWTSYRRSNPINGYPQYRNPCVQPSRITGRYWKWIPSTS